MSLVEQDKKYIWHPYTQMKTAKDHLPIVKAKGAYLFSEDGRQILDAVSSWWTNSHGHGHPHIGKALSSQFEQLEHVIFAGFTHPKAVELSQRIIGHLPYLQKVFFSDNGSTAVEVGIKMAIQYWYNKGIKRKKIVAFKGAYHGDTFGAMSVGERGAFSEPFSPYLFDVAFIDVPTKGKEELVQSQLKAILETEEIAAFIFEPLVQGAAGMVMYQPAILDELVTMCRNRGVLIIADEVMTGFGRTGKFFATDHISNKPDIVALSKGLTGGVMPLGLTVCSQSIFDVFLSDDHSKTFFHGHSFTGHALACAVACASMDLMEEEATWENIENIIASHQNFALELEKIPLLDDVRQQGTILAFEITSNSDTSYFNSMRDRLYDHFMDQNILLRPLGNVLYILPPYCITQEELQKVYTAILDLLEKLQHEN